MKIASHLEKQIELLKLSLTSSFGLLLTLNRGLLIMLSLTDLLLNTSLSAASLESAKSTVQRFILFHDYSCHILEPNLPPAFRIVHIS
jgi:hypothetical protein